MIRSSVAVDSRLTSIENGMRSLALGPATQTPRGFDEPDEVPRIPMQQIEFGEEISRREKKTHILRVEHAEIVDLMGTRRSVVLRRFQIKPEVADEDQGFEEFRREVDFRADLLNRHFARMLGVASSSTGRTKMIVMAAGTIPAYDYLQSLSGVDYFLEEMRIMCEFVAGYRFLREHRGSWRGGVSVLTIGASSRCQS
ncbi:hypothetical protein SISSUDRAFT_520751 [Sistotremastrum suecicum HHB10207 ss-3]|uniref:Protein kinase domain-containing protein n=1 Tax=Sistotremastrum suecicum HHB10207 ss-3 TaxID=1314776 RepID=A0A165XYS9_9AGAM|nr:hypothetical protein SISSUDRAFT_520751 [Sistotremastrum suecicum HHB10207 ss-3]